MMFLTWVNIAIDLDQRNTFGFAKVDHISEVVSLMEGNKQKKVGKKLNDTQIKS